MKFLNCLFLGIAVLSFSPGSSFAQSAKSCKSTLDEFKMLTFTCDDKAVAKAFKSSPAAFTACLRVHVNSYPKKDRLDDYFSIPDNCAKPAIMTASADPRFGKCLSELYPLFFGYLTAAMLSGECSNPKVMQASQKGLIVPCLQKKLKTGTLRGSIGALMAVTDCSP